MKPWQTHILAMSEHLEALEAEGHLEKKPAARHHHWRAENVIHDLEQALIQEDRQKGETDGTVG